MGEKTGITFSTATWNPWQGCIKVSEGCKFCYMYRDKERYGIDATVVHRSTERTFRMPLRLPAPEVIFTCSWSDWFIEQADEWRPAAWQIIRQTPQHFYLIFTKRTERIEECLPPDWGAGYENVMLVATVENQEQAQKRSIELLGVEALYHGLSLEPLLGAIDFSRVTLPSGMRGLFSVLDAMDWVVIGGESGNDTGYYRYRPCELGWIDSAVNQSVNAQVATFVKQMGTHLAKEMHLADRHGANVREFPPRLRVQQHIKPVRAILDLKEAK